LTTTADPFSFDNGSYSTYNVNRPNAIKAINDSQPCLVFSNVDTSNGVAGVCFSGLFPSSNQPGKVFVSSIPFETIYPDSEQAIFLKAVLDFFEGASEVESPDGSPVQQFALAPNYPNPFNADTRIAFSLSVRSQVRLTVYNSLGQMVTQLADEFFDTGWHSIFWQTRNLPSGIYFYRLEALGLSKEKNGFD
jgi:hypothetical protein